MKHPMKIGIVIAVIILFVGTSVIPGIGGNTSDPNDLEKEWSSSISRKLEESLNKNIVSEIALGDLGSWTGARKLARTSDGILFCVYNRTDGLYSQIYCSYSINNGETWNEEPLTSEDYNQTFPSITVDSNDNLHVVWQGCHDNSPIHTQIRYRKHDTEWREIENITSDYDWDHRSPANAVDGNDYLHVVYQKVDYIGGTWCSLGCGPLWYTNNIQGFWKAPKMIGEDAEYNDAVPSISIGPNNYIHVTFDAGGYHNANCWHSAYRRNNTNFWEPIEFFPCYDNGPSIAVDNLGNVHLVTKYSYPLPGIKYRMRNDMAWVLEEIVQNTVPATVSKYPSISLDSNEYIHVVWPNEGNIFYSKKTTSWSDIETLVSDTDSTAPHSIWSCYPEINGVRTNVPKNGFAFVWNDGDMIKFYKSEDLEWEGEPQPFYFVHITDPHVVNVTQKDVWEEDIEKIRNMNPPPDFVLCTGDLVEWGNGSDGADNYNELLEFGIIYGTKPNFFIDEEEKIPIYFCPGNHDARKGGVRQVFPPYNFSNYYDKIGSDYWSKIRKNCAIFSLNSGADIWPWKYWPPWTPEGDGLDDKYSNEFTNFTNNVYNCNEDIKIVIFHHPYIGNTTNKPADGAFYYNRSAFIQACNDSEVDMLFCGHLHDVGKVIPIGNNTVQVNTRALSEGQWYRTIDIGPSYPRGYKINSMEKLSSTISGDIFSVCMENSLTTVDIYDELGNHNGLIWKGDIERQIPISAYSYWILENDTYGNFSYTEFMLPKNDSKNYTIIIESYSDDSINVTYFTSLVGGNWIEAKYVNVTMYNGSIATTYANNSILNYTMVIEDPDRTIRTVAPTSYEENSPPVKPSLPIGPTQGLPGIEYTYTTNTTDLNGNDVYYWFDWGDGTNSDWLGPYSSNESCNASHSWNSSGFHEIKVKAKDDYSLEGDWSDPLLVDMLGDFIRGDADGDGNVTMGDAIYILKYLYVPGSPTPSCLDSADVDDSGIIEMSDALYLLKHLYVPGSPEPPYPYLDCGQDPTEDSLDCQCHICFGCEP